MAPRVTQDLSMNGAEIQVAARGLDAAQALAVVDEIGALAAAEGWAQVAQAAAAAGRPPAAAGALLVLGAGVSAPELQAWVAERTGQVAEVASLDAAVAQPARLLAYSRVLVVFSTDSLPSPADLQGRASLVSIVPSSGLASVMLMRGDFSQVADRDAVSRLAWGLFVPEPKPVWSDQPLAPRRVFLWAAPSPSRGEGDGAGALADWLAAPPAADADLDRALSLLDYLIGLADQAAGAGAAEAARQDAAAKKAGTGPAGSWQAGEAEQSLKARLEATISEAEAFHRRRLADMQVAIDQARTTGGGSPVSTRRRIEEELIRLRIDLETHARDLQRDWAAFVEQTFAGAPGDAEAAGPATGHAAWREALVLDTTPDPSLFRPEAPQPASAAPGAGPGPAVIVGGGAVAGLAVGLLTGPVGAGLGAAAGVAGGLLIEQQRRQRLAERAGAAQGQWLESWRIRTEGLLTQQLLAVDSDLSARVRQVFRALRHSAGSPAVRPAPETAAIAQVRRWRALRVGLGG